MTSITCVPTKPILQFSDANVKRKQSVGFSPETKTVGAMTNVQTTVTLNTAAGLYDQIQDVNGVYDAAVNTYLAIDDEVMQYGSGAISGNTVTITRGARGTTAATHDNDSDATTRFRFKTTA